MSFILAALLVSNQPLPFIDRSALRTLARLEAAQDARSRPAKAWLARPAKEWSVRDDRAVAHPCGVADDAESRSAVGRAYSMFGPTVSIIEPACALRRSSLARPQPVRVATR